MKPTPPPGRKVRKRSVARTLGLAAAWLFGIPLALIAALYAALLVQPIPLPFISDQVRNLLVASMPPETELELGDMALALEGYAWPVIQFSPVTYRDNANGGRVAMEALEVGFSPVRALIGQDMALVTPGVRPAGTASGDQKRVATPASAIAAGADYLVVGRPVTTAPDPGGAARSIIAEIEAALAARESA